MSATSDREKVYVCVDTDLPDNARVQRLKDPAGSLGVWLAMTCYTRWQLTDGHVPKRYARSLWGDPANQDRLDDMVAVGLLSDLGDEYLVLRYAPRNQTKAMVEESKRKSRERMAKWRANGSRKTSGDASVTPDVTAAVTSTVTSSVTRDEIDSCGVGPISISPSISSDLPEGERERGLLPAERVIQPTDVLPAELRSAAEMIGVRDIDGAWLKFCGHYAGQVHHVSGRWQSWCARERSQEARQKRPAGARPEAGSRGAAYEAAAAGVLGHAWALDEFEAQQRIEAIVSTHCREADVDAWLSRAVAVFVRAVRRDERHRGGYGPRALLAWLNEGGKVPTAAAAAGALRPERPATRPVARTKPADEGPVLSAAESEAKLAELDKIVANIGRGSAVG